MHRASLNENETITRSCGKQYKVYNTNLLIRTRQNNWWQCMCTYGKSACFPAIPETLAEQSNSNIFGMKQKLPSVQRTGHCSVNEKRAKIKTHRKCPCYGRLHSMSRKSCNAIEKSMNGGMNISRSIHPFSEYIKR